MNSRIWLAKRYFRARVSAGLTQLEVAELTGLDRKIISRLENGHNIPSLENFLLLLKAIDLNPAMFFKGFDC
jgi:transcriptional regulator with XRE-family HTH domain